MQGSPYGFWLPLDISTHGAGIDNLINLLHWFMALLFVGWGIYLVYVLVKFRQRPGHSPTRVEHHFRLPMWIEVGIAIFEVMLLVFLSSPIWFKVKSEFPAEKDALVVRVVAEQFAWNIHYPGADNKFGRTRPELVDSGNPVGVDRNDPNGKDDIVTINNLHIPVNKPVIAHLSSKDVIHNFFLPVLRVKQDVIPGMTIPVWFQATKTSPPETEDQYEIGCAQLCGLGHYRMRGMLFVDTPEKYAAFMAEEEKALKEALGDTSAAPAPAESQPTAAPAEVKTEGSTH